MSWDVHIKATFQACIWLIWRHFNIAESAEMQNLWKLCCSAPLGVLRVHLHPPPPSYFPTLLPHYYVRASHKTSIEIISPKNPFYSPALVCWLNFYIFYDFHNCALLDIHLQLDCSFSPFQVSQVKSHFCKNQTGWWSDNLKISELLHMLLLLVLMSQENL